MSLKDFVNLVLVFQEISPRYGSDRIKVLLSTVVICGRFMINLLMTILQHLLVNGKGLLFFKNASVSYQRYILLEKIYQDGCTRH